VADYTILITDRNCQVIGDPIIGWQTIDATLRFNEPSSGSFTVPGYNWIRQMMIPGCRVVVVRDQQILIAGPLEKWQYERSDDGDNAGDGMLTVNFADDLALLVARCTYPDPTLAPSAQTLDNWTYSGLAEDALRDLANRQSGPGALTDRQVPQLVLGTYNSLGSAVTAKAELFEPLGDVLRRVAVDGGGLGFRTQQVGTQIEFQVYQPLDLDTQVFFGFGLGNLKYISYEVSAPEATAALVGGQGEGADRFVLERVNAGGQEAWGRMETLVSRPGNDPTADLEQAGDDELADKAESVRLPTSASDTANQRFGVHYGLGSTVSIETWPGSMITDVVTSVHIQAWPTAGEIVSPTIGSQAERTDPAWIRRLRAMDRRIGYLERNVVPAVV
jgi:Siphovirus ReqiPepy6 Gp37-like protein